MYFDTIFFTERLDVLSIDNAHINNTIRFVKDGDSYDVKCSDGYEVAQGLNREDQYIGGEQDKLKTFKIQNKNGRHVYLVKNDEYPSLVCREGKQRISDQLRSYTCKLC